MTQLAKQQRLKTQHEFKNVLQTGKKFVAQQVVVWGLPNEEGISRLGLIVSKRVGNAVVRNRIKRRLRNIFRQTAQSIQTPQDIVIIARKTATEDTYHEIALAVSRSFKWLERKLA
ncbi:MAG: ribonuclease P protein component [Deltaproteobacteria bacterium]|nr:ribonuclease P protein component [Deltaproteobacteria bacterium]